MMRITTVDPWSLRLGKPAPLTVMMEPGRAVTGSTVTSLGGTVTSTEPVRPRLSLTRSSWVPRYHGGLDHGQVPGNSTSCRLLPH